MAKLIDLLCAEDVSSDDLRGVVEKSGGRRSRKKRRVAGTGRNNGRNGSGSSVKTARRRGIDY